MSTKVQREFTFQAGVYFESRFLMNLYTATITMYVDTEDIREQNVAVDRMKFYIHECIENSIFISEDEAETIEKYNDANLKVCVLPIEPYDQVVAMLLLTKLNVIVEERMSIVEVSILSKLSDSVKILYDIEQPMGPFEKDGWWNSKKIVINDLKVSKNRDNVVKIFPKPSVTWEDLGLGWIEKDTDDLHTGTIVPIREP